MSGKVIAIIAAVVVVGGGAYVFLNNGNAPEGAETSGGSEVRESTSETEQISEVDIPSSGSGSFESLLKLGGNATCDFMYTEPESGAEVEGRVYVADNGELFRGDFTMKHQGTTYESHVIRDGSKGYTWSETPYGSMALEFEIQGEEDVFQSNDEGGFDYDQEFDYSCQRWSVNSSFFVPPSEIEFTNMTEQMNAIQSGTNDVRSMQCAACDNIPDANAKAQCKAQLGC